MKPVVEHVFSRDLGSSIFKDIFAYFNKYSEKFRFVSDLTDHGETPDYRIYHRPQLEAELKSPCATVVHHDLEDWDIGVKIEKFMPGYRQSDVLICISETQQKILANNNLHNTHLIHHGYNELLLSNRKSNCSEKAPAKIKLGLFSRRYDGFRKGEAFLFELALRLPPDRFEFVLIGKDRHLDLPWLESVGFTVHCQSYVPYPVLCKAYQGLGALLMLSTREGAPACIPEALVSGVPIIARPVGMVPEMFKAEDVGLLLTDNANTDAAAIVKMFDQDISAQRRRIIDADLVNSWKEVIFQYELLIEAELVGINNG